jgi:MFS family permease
MGQGVIWYTGQFYAQNFLETKCNLEFEQSRTIMLWAILFATPFFVFWGWLSDRIGRKWIMMVGMLLGVLTFRPIFNTFLKDTNVKNWNNEEYFPWKNESKEKIPGIEDKTIFITSGKSSFKDGGSYNLIIKDTLEVNYDSLIIGTPPYYIPGGEVKIDPSIKKPEFKHRNVVYKDIHLSQPLYWKFIGLVFILILYVTMVYGPIAAFLVEMFPTKIRYTSMSLPYHIGNGVFGGLVPFIGLLLTTTFTTDPLVGLWYPIGVATLCFIIGTIYLRNKIDKDVTD